MLQRYRCRLRVAPSRFRHASLSRHASPAFRPSPSFRRRPESRLAAIRLGLAVAAVTVLAAGCGSESQAARVDLPPSAPPASEDSGPVVEVVPVRTTPPLDPNAAPTTPLGELRARYLPVWSSDFDWAFPPEVCGSDWPSRRHRRTDDQGRLDGSRGPRGSGSTVGDALRAPPVASDGLARPARTTLRGRRDSRHGAYGRPQPAGFPPRRR